MLKLYHTAHKKCILHGAYDPLFHIKESTEQNGCMDFYKCKSMMDGHFVWAMFIGLGMSCVHNDDVET